MGYYTNFILNKIEGSDEDFEALVKEINDMHGYDFSSEDVQEGTWYDHSKELKKLTRRWPGLLVELYGDGENSEDQWAARYRNGQEEVQSYIRDDVRFEKLVTADEKKENDQSLKRRTLKVVVRLPEGKNIEEKLVFDTEQDLKTAKHIIRMLKKTFCKHKD